MHKTILTVFLTLVGVGIAYATYTFVIPNNDVYDGNKNNNVVIEDNDPPTLPPVPENEEPETPPIIPPVEREKVKEPETPPEPPEQPPVIKNVVDRQAIARSLTTEDMCESEGGVWKRGFSPYYFCVLETSDGGNSCTDSVQCESWCQAPSGSNPGQIVVGSCFEATHASCGQEVEDRIAGPAWCE